MNQGKLQSYASIGEIVSAVAIVVSLIYVGYEFRQSRTVSNRDAEMMLFDRFAEMNRLEIQTPGLAELLIAGQTEPESLSPGDRRRVETYERGFYNNWEIAWYYHRDGILEPETWTDWDQYFQQSARHRPAWVWTAIREDFMSSRAGPKFHEHVDYAIARNAALQK